jgi:hypothetical protein
MLFYQERVQQRGNRGHAVRHYLLRSYAKMACLVRTSLAWSYIWSLLRIGGVYRRGIGVQELADDGLAEAQTRTEFEHHRQVSGAGLPG